MFGRLSDSPIVLGLFGGWLARAFVERRPPEDASSVIIVLVFLVGVALLLEQVWSAVQERRAES